MTSDNAHPFLCSQSKADPKEFKWDRLHAELSNNTPTLLSILLAATNSSFDITGYILSKNNLSLCQNHLTSIF